MTSEVTAWLALHRAHEGGVTKLNGEYFTMGRPAAEFLVAAFDELISNGLLTLGRPDPLGCQRVCVTHIGQAKYAELHSLAVRTGMVADERR